MLSTSQTLLCPTCGRPATLRAHTQRSRSRAHRHTFEAVLSFACRRGCTVDQSTLAALYGIDDADVPAQSS